MSTPTSAPREGRPDAALLVAWLLLLLAEGESYGRALFHRLGKGGISIEYNHAYRILRGLDREGAITSRWTASDAGPQRRSYRITSDGRARLAESAASVVATLRLQETFLRAYDERALTRGGGERPVPRASPPAQDDPAPAVGQELLAAWLMLLVAPEASYGYGLRRALEDHRVRAEPGAVYRVLRRLEREGWLRSGWERSATGPRRRLYRLTDEGRRHLGSRAASIAASRDSHLAFVRAYEQVAGRLD